MPMPPNHQKLIVTGKNKKATDYGTDMRTIEQWANEGIVRSLHAGSGITLSPSTGVDTGTGITINSTGGGGGTSVGYFAMYAGPDGNAIELHAFYMGMGGGQVDDALSNLQAQIPVFSNATGTTQWVSFGSGWMTKAGVGESVNVLPEFTAPAFTGGPILVACEIAAGNATMSNYAIFTAGVSFTSTEDYQFQSTDFATEGHAGADLSLVNGSGQTGVGIVSAAGGVYWGGITGAFQIPTGTTFT